MEAVVWEWPIFIDLWAAGVAGGGFFAAFLVDRLTGRKHKLAVQIATWVGVPLVLLGVLLLVLDLGNQLWAWHLFVRFYPVSPMSLGSWILTLWSIGSVALVALWFAEMVEPTEQPADLFAQVASWLRPLVPATEILLWIVFVLSVLLITYTGVLLSSTRMPLWSTALLPTLFVTSAIFTGTSLIRLILALLGSGVVGELGKAILILAAVQAVVLVAFLLAVPAGLLIAGPLSLLFWLGVVLIGVVVPFAVELWALRAKVARLLAPVSSVCVLLGGLALRAVLVIGGQM